MTFWSRWSSGGVRALPGSTPLSQLFYIIKCKKELPSLKTNANNVVVDRSFFIEFWQAWLLTPPDSLFPDTPDCIFMVLFKEKKLY